jgi:hypothetical protein
MARLNYRDGQSVLLQLGVPAEMIFQTECVREREQKKLVQNTEAD